MSRKLVLIHGRAQQHKDAAALKLEWIGALRNGLAANGLELPIAETDIRFPYYGDTLDDLVGGVDPEVAARVVVRGAAPADADEQKFVNAVAEEIAAELGISDEEIDE